MLDAAWFREPPRPVGGDETTRFDQGDLRPLLACPVCRGDLEWEPRRIRCTDCGAEYDRRDGIPVLRPPQSDGDGHKEQQESFFDTADAEFEITRPHGTPWF